MEKGSGQKFIDALSRRGLRGSFFDFEGYRTLRSLKSDEEVLQFLKQQGIDCDLDMSNVDEVIRKIGYAQTINELSNPITWVWVDPTGCLFVIAFPFVAFYYVVKCIRKWLI